MAALLAPSALTAAYFGLGQSRQSRSLLHTAPALRSGVPSRRRLPGPRGLRFATQIYISRLRLRRRVLTHLALQAPLLSLLKSRICGAWNYAHEDQEQRIAALSQKPKPKPKPRPKPRFDFSVLCCLFWPLRGQARSHRVLRGSQHLRGVSAGSTLDLNLRGTCGSGLAREEAGISTTHGAIAR